MASRGRLVTFYINLYDADMAELMRVDVPDWIRTLAASHPFGVRDRRGHDYKGSADRAPRRPCLGTIVYGNGSLDSLGERWRSGYEARLR